MKLMSKITISPRLKVWKLKQTEFGSQPRDSLNLNK